MPPQLPETADALLPEPIGAGLAPERPVVAAPKAMLWPVLRGLGIAVLAVAWALIAHVTSAGNESSGWGAALALTPMSTALALLLSAVIHPNQDSHRLEAIAERFNVPVIGRHTAMGDAMVTADAFLRLIPLLAEKGIHTLGQACTAAERTYYARLKY